MADKKRTPQNFPNNPNQDWHRRMQTRGEDLYGEGDDYFGEGFSDRRNRQFQAAGHNSANMRQRSAHQEHDTSNYGRGGYYGNTYDPDGYLRTNDGDPWRQRFTMRQGYRSNEERLRSSGLHRGKGPRNYRRSDERILEDIHDRLSEDPFVDASDIEIQISSGEVTLTGTVEDRDAKRRAEDVTASVTGTTNVENRLRVKKIQDWKP